MCNCLPMALDKDFIRLMRLVAAPPQRPVISGIINQIPPAMQVVTTSSCELENWYWGTARAMHEMFGVPPRKFFGQDAAGTVRLTPRGDALLLTLSAKEAMGVL